MVVQISWEFLANQYKIAGFASSSDIYYCP
jgi:hypothetical protein